MTVVVKQTKISAVVFKNLKLLHEFLYMNYVWTMSKNMLGDGFKQLFTWFLVDE